MPTLCGPTPRPTQGSRILTSSGSRNCTPLALVFAAVAESMIFNKFDFNRRHAVKHNKGPTAILADYQAGPSCGRPHAALG